MSTYTQLYYHIVFSTKERHPVLVADHREELLRYIWGIVTNKHSHLYRINGTTEHLHLLTGIHPTVALAEFVKDIKVASSEWIKQQCVFSRFTHWQDGYSAFTVSHGGKDAVIDYIRNQTEHHKKVPFMEELKSLLTEAGIAFDATHLQ